MCSGPHLRIPESLLLAVFVGNFNKYHYAQSHRIQQVHYLVHHSYVVLVNHIHSLNKIANKLSLRQRTDVQSINHSLWRR